MLSRPSTAIQRLVELADRSARERRWLPGRVARRGLLVADRTPADEAA